MKFLMNHVMRDHVALGGAAALAALPWFGWRGSLLFWLANILIDLDHYLHFAYARRGKSLGVKEMFLFHQSLFDQVRRPDFLALEIFHTVEFMALLGWLSFGVLPSLQPVFWGMAFHIGVDFVHLAKLGVFTKRCNSCVEYVLRRNAMLRRSLSPDWVMNGKGAA